MYTVAAGWIPTWGSCYCIPLEHLTPFVILNSKHNNVVIKGRASCVGLDDMTKNQSVIWSLRQSAILMTSLAASYNWIKSVVINKCNKSCHILACIKMFSNILKTKILAPLPECFTFTSMRIVIKSKLWFKPKKTWCIFLPYPPHLTAIQSCKKSIQCKTVLNHCAQFSCGKSRRNKSSCIEV